MASVRVKFIHSFIQRVWAEGLSEQVLARDSVQWGPQCEGCSRRSRQGGVDQPSEKEAGGEKEVSLGLFKTSPEVSWPGLEQRGEGH